MYKSGKMAHPASHLSRIGGQVPSNANMELLRLAQAKPKPANAAQLLQYTDPIMRIEGITKGLGLDEAQMSSWNKFLESQLDGDTNELVMRQALYQRMMGERMDPELRKAIFQRAMMYQKGKVKKSLVEIVSPDELLQKADPRGGEYHRRVPKKSGKGYNYFYEEEKYNSHPGAHLSGKDARSARIQKAVTSLVESCDKGCSLADMKALAKRHGTKDVASVLKKQCGCGAMTYKSGKFSVTKKVKGDQTKTDKVKKSLEPEFRFVIGSD